MSDPQAVTTVLAFDFGYKRIGIAVGNVLIDTTNPLTTISAVGREPDWSALRRVLDEWSPDLLLVGLPLMLDGTPSPNANDARRFAARLQELSGVDVLMVDEKLSSLEAREGIRESRQAGLRRRTRPGDIDKFAAEVILRTWLNQRGGRRPDPEDH